MKTVILAIGRNKEILEVVVRLLNANDAWSGVGAVTDEQAVAFFEQSPVDIVLLCNGIEEEEETSLRAHFVAQKPDIIIIQHYGGGSGLLSNEILAALDKKGTSA